jgi:hypothetical protein
MTKQKKLIYELPLVNQKFHAIVDRNRKKDVKRYNWYAYYCRTTGTYYPYAKINGKRIKLHNYLMSNFKPSIGCSIDHINRDTLDARSSNLRIANGSIQSINQRIGKRNKTGVKGLTYNTKHRIIIVSWIDENMKHQQVHFYYHNIRELRSVFIKGFILRKNKEREIEKYRIALCLNSTPYNQTLQSLTEPAKEFEKFMERNKNVDFNFRLPNTELEIPLSDKNAVWRINQKPKKTNKSGITGVYLNKNKRVWIAAWQEEGKTRERSFSYKNEKEFRLAYIKAFIFRRNKEREVNTYQLALNLDNIPYDQDPKSLTEPGEAFDAFMEKNRGKDFNFVKNK